MPNSDGSMTQQELDRANAWFEQHWHGRIRCPLGHETWQIGQYLVELPIFHPGRVVGDSVLAHVMVSCTTCTYTMLFQAAPMGILMPEAGGTRYV